MPGGTTNIVFFLQMNKKTPGGGGKAGGFPGSAFPEVDLCIIADIKAAGFPLDLGVTAYEGMGQDDIVKVGKGADNGIFEDRVVDPGLFADGHVGTHDGIADIAARGDAYRLDDDRIFELVFRSDSTAEFLQ